jgi:hypothetical protein
MLKVKLRAVGQLMLLASCLGSWEGGPQFVLFYFLRGSLFKDLAAVFTKPPITLNIVREAACRM